LEETVSVIKGFMADGPFSFAGVHFTVVEIEGVPEPREHASAEIAGRWGVTLADALNSPYFLVGTVEEMCDQSRARRERFGVSMHRTGHAV
jgi:hypothetical protein